MFKGLFQLIVLALFVGGWALAGASLHVVRTQDKIAVIPKSRLGWNDTYVDLRQWSTADLPRHTEVIDRLTATGHADLLASVTDSKKGGTPTEFKGTSQPSPSANAILEHSTGMPPHH